MLLDGLLKEGVIVDRPTRPSSITLSDDETVLKDTSKYPITVCGASIEFIISCLTILKVVLDHLEGEAVQQEVVHAKFLVGADGILTPYPHKYCMLIFCRCSLVGPQSFEHSDGRRTDE